MNADYAEHAKKYAREQILMGYTQLETNLYDVHKREALTAAVAAIQNHPGLTEHLAKIDDYLKEFERRVALCKKFSLGNCHELAEMALYYMLVNHRNIRSEIYKIAGGEHAFLVIGRASRSDPHKPEEWGKDAYICDPWSDSVYKASEYLTKTKNYVSEDRKVTLEDGSQIDDFVNAIEDFDPSKHKLSPVEKLNSDHILHESFRANQLLVKVFLSVNKTYLNAYDEFAKNLDKIAERLKKEYGENDPKFLFVSNEINIIRGITKDLKENLCNNLKTGKYQSYEETQRLIKDKIQSLRDLPKNDILQDYHKKESLITLIMRFLNIKPRSAQDYDAALKTLNNTMRPR